MAPKRTFHGLPPRLRAPLASEAGSSGKLPRQSRYHPGAGKHCSSLLRVTAGSFGDGEQQSQARRGSIITSRTKP